MTKLSALLLIFISVFARGSGSESNLGIRKFVSPDYPNVARQAQVSGDVHLLISVTVSGAVRGAEVRSGPPILAAHAKKNILTWHFTNQLKDGELEVVYRYRLQEPRVYGQVVPSVSLESPTEVVIISSLPLPSGHPE